MSILVVTTFSKAGYDCYGRRFVDSFLKFAPDTPLACYHESMDVDRIAPNLEWRNLDRDSDRALFIREHSWDAEKVGTAREPNSQAIRFCHKVFALTHAATISQAEWLVWIDADVVFKAAPAWDEVLPLHASLSFLGRQQVRMYTECGFVGYRLSDPRVRMLLEGMRSYYTSGEIFTRPRTDWHDSRCFDIYRERSGIPAERQHNLSDGVIATHVWPHTKLQAFSEHLKGPGRKHRFYGGIVP
jgi:hypothetical protein